MFITKLVSLKDLGWVRNRIPGRRRSSSLTLQLHMISLNATHVWWLKFGVSKLWSIYGHIYLNMVIEIKYCQRDPWLITSWIQDGGSSTSSRMSLSSSSPVWGTLALQTKLFDFDFLYFQGHFLWKSWHQCWPASVSSCIRSFHRSDKQSVRLDDIFWAWNAPGFTLSSSFYGGANFYPTAEKAIFWGSC